MKIEEMAYAGLLDLYKGLLTPTKAEIAEMYFSCDLSLSEIAEIKNCTRQSVLDAIKSVKTELNAFEEKIGFKNYQGKIKEFTKHLSDEQLQILNGILDK